MSINFCLPLLCYPILRDEFLADWRAKAGPSVRRGIETVLEPAFRLARPQEIENAEQDDKGQHPERKSGGNVIKPNPEKEREEIHQAGRHKDVFPIPSIHAEAFQ